MHAGVGAPAYVETVLSAAAPAGLALLALLHLRRPSKSLAVAGLTAGVLVAARVFWRDFEARDGGAVSIFARFFAVALGLLGVWRRIPHLGVAFLAAPVALRVPGVGLHLGRRCGPAYTVYVAALVPVYLYGLCALAATWRRAPAPAPAVV
jgi:hypothetical protein